VRFLFAHLPSLALATMLGSGTLLPAPAVAQRPELEITLPDAAQLATVGPVVQARHMLSQAKTREMLTASFPLRLHFRIELWSEGSMLNNIERTTEYDVVVRYSAMDKQYEVVQLVDDRPLSLGKYTRIEDAEGAVARRTRVAITPIPVKRRQYYLATLETRMLSLSDLDEVERWLRGDLQPGLTGAASPGTVLTRGLRTVAAKLLGSETREYEASSPSFRLP
jgi:hypothetical protein